MWLWMGLAAAEPALDAEIALGAAGALDPFLIGRTAGLGAVEAGVSGGLRDETWSVEGAAAYDLAEGRYRRGHRGVGHLAAETRIGDELGVDLRARADIDSHDRELFIDRPRQLSVLEGLLEAAPSLSRGAIDAEGLVRVDGTVVANRGTVYGSQRRVTSEAGVGVHLLRLDVHHELASSRIEPFYSGVKSRDVHLVSAHAGLQTRGTDIYELHLRAGPAALPSANILYPEFELLSVWHAPWLTTHAALGVEVDTPWYANWGSVWYWERGVAFAHPELGPTLDGRMRISRIQADVPVGESSTDTLVGGRLDARLAIGWGRGRVGYELYGHARLAEGGGFRFDDDLSGRDYSDLRAGVNVFVRPLRSP